MTLLSVGMSAVPASGEAPVVDAAAASGTFSMLWLVIAVPAVSAAIMLLGGRRTDRWGHLLGSGAPIASFVISLVMFLALVGRDADDRSINQQLFTWIEVGGFKVDAGLLYDPLSALFVLLITGVGSLIHVYSIGYMAHDDRRRRFFG